MRPACHLIAASALSLLVPGLWAAGPSPASPATDGTLPALTAIAGQGLLHSQAFPYLTQLSDDIGGRVTGSPEAQQAITWALATMRAIGLENVHTEPWQIAHGWTRGVAEAELVAPIHRKLLVDALGWVGSTAPGGADAEVIPVNLYQLPQEMAQNTGHWAGKVLLVRALGQPPKDAMSAFAAFGGFLKAAYAAHAVAVIGGQGGRKSAGMHLTHTGALGFDVYYDIPVVSMGAEDQAQLERYLDRGKTVRLHINVQNRVTAGPVETANVVGDIPGTEHPEQVVVIGGHLDSWDLASGATDDGTGAVSALSAAEAILRSGFRPKRTVRVVLFTGEEEGLLGSLAYTKRHQADLANHLGALILDNGQGPVSGFNLGGHADLTPAVEAFATAVPAFGDLKVDDKIEFGTDCGPFILAGLPGINMDQDSPEYKYTHHSAVDTLDKVKPEVLIHNATLMALAAFWIADRPDRLASPWPAERTAAMLTEKHQDGFLKALGLWPFPAAGSAH